MTDNQLAVHALSQATTGLTTDEQDELVALTKALVFAPDVDCPQILGKIDALQAKHDFSKVLAEFRKGQVEGPEFYTLPGTHTVLVYSSKFSQPVLEVCAYDPQAKSRRDGRPHGCSMADAKELALRIADALNEGRV